MVEKQTAEKKSRFAVKVFIIDAFFMLISSAVLYQHHAHLVKPVALGYAVYIIPTVYFYYRMLKFSAANNINQGLGFLYRAEIGKFVLTLSLFMISFFAMNLAAAPIALFFAAYMALLVIHQLVMFGVIKVSSN